MLQLKLGGVVNVAAVGLLTTRLPDGAPGFSLFILITAAGFAPLPLGMGFTLTGIGGLLGINRTALKDTALLLADALRLTGQVRALFVAAARGRAPAADVIATGNGAAAQGAGAVAATRTLPRDIGSFTGREAELSELLAVLAEAAEGGGVVGIHAIDGMAGAGKTALAVHAAHRLAGRFPDGQFFVPLHAHTPGQRQVEPADALASLLLTAGAAAQQIPPGLEARAARWRDFAAGKKILLLLDDAAGH